MQRVPEKPGPGSPHPSPIKRGWVRVPGGWAGRQRRNLVPGPTTPSRGTGAVKAFSIPSHAPSWIPSQKRLWIFQSWGNSFLIQGWLTDAHRDLPGKASEQHPGQWEWRYPSLYKKGIQVYLLGWYRARPGMPNCQMWWLGTYYLFFCIVLNGAGGRAPLSTAFLLDAASRGHQREPGGGEVGTRLSQPPAGSLEHLPHPNSGLHPSSSRVSEASSPSHC